MKNKVLETIKKYNLIENGDKLVLGVSGGPDSISMLNILNEIRKDDKVKLNYEIVVVHINHMIRKEAVDDELYVKEYCDKRNIDFYSKSIDVKKLANTNKIGTEEAGRNVRYEFFNEILEKTSSNKIAIAHNKNDNAETMIMNIMRGSGISGLKGIEPKRGIYIRPLIECEREEIEKYCEKNKLNPRIDKTNFENEYTRNKIRNIVIEQKENEIILDLKKFNVQEKVIKSRLILYTITRILGTAQGMEKIHIEDIIKLCSNNIGNKYLTPNKKLKILVKNHKIYFLRQI